MKSVTLFQILLLKEFLKKERGKKKNDNNIRT